MNFDLLNEMITYIENNLDSEIDYNKLSKITKTNFFILERIFMFLTNMTIKEYIKKRRLSKSFEEIRNTNQKIIDIAFKYQYNSASSFNRAFKQLFNMTPTECRNGIGNYKLIPIQYFEKNKKIYNFDYEIKKLEEKIIYCYHLKSKSHSDLLYKIRELYNKIKSDGTYYGFNEAGMYGIFFKNNNIYHYLLGSKKKYKDLEKYKIPSGKYAMFSSSSRKQENIVEFEQKINKQWLPSTNYNINEVLKIEYYNDNFCYIYLKVE